MIELKRRVYEILEAADEEDRVSRVVDRLILTLIGLSVLVVVAESVQPIGRAWAPVFWWFEVVTVSVFSIEYLLRLWCCTVSSRYPTRFHFITSAMGVIDLMAILPFFLSQSGLDLRFVRAVRLIRLFRLAKVARYPSVLGTFGRVLRSKREELVTTLALVMVVLLVASGLMYFAENDAQPMAFSSIPAAMWWGVATLTTVGYGDVYPVTSLGRFLGSGVAILGIGLFALPTGILGAAFVEELDSRKQASQSCPHCGKEL